jgi:hypothetical protein
MTNKDLVHLPLKNYSVANDQMVNNYVSIIHVRFGILEKEESTKQR